MTKSPIKQFPSWAVIGLIQSHYEKDDKKFEYWTKEIQYFLNKEGREEIADYIHCLRMGTGFVPMEKKNENSNRL